MLRPACLLPTRGLAPLCRLLTLRSDGQVSPLRLESAIRRSDAYRLGTYTRWTGAAGKVRPFPLRSQFFLCFTTHHGLNFTDYANLIYCPTILFYNKIVHACRFMEGIAHELRIAP